MKRLALPTLLDPSPRGPAFRCPRCQTPSDFPELCGECYADDAEAAREEAWEARCAAEDAAIRERAGHA